jgi:hypothetical protein
VTDRPSTSLDLLHDIAAALEKDGPVEIGTMFRSPGLRVGDKVVAFLGRGDRLIVTLARPRAAALIEDGTAEPVTMGTRTMREWVAIPPRLDTESTRETWTALAREALRFVRQSPD